MQRFEFQNLKVFLAIKDHKSFSKAAKALHISQPAISLVISKLESNFGSKLFQRVGHEMVMTPFGVTISKKAQAILDMASDLSNTVDNHHQLIQGKVKYAMPESCQWTPHFKKIMSQLKSQIEIQFEIDILPAPAVAEKIKSSELDFGFITGDLLEPELRIEKFSHEVYTFVSSDIKQIKFLEMQEFALLRHVTYPGWELYFSTWSKKLKFGQKLEYKMNTPKVKIGSLIGAIHALEQGAGSAVVPRHCVLEQIKEKKLFEFEVKDMPFCPIYLAWRLGDKLSKRASWVMDQLRIAKKEIG